MYIITGHTKGLGKLLTTRLEINKKKTVGLSRSKLNLELINLEEYIIDFSNPEFDNLQKLKNNLSKYKEKIYFIINAFTYGLNNPDLHDLNKTLSTNLLNQLRCIEYLKISNENLKIILIGSQEGFYKMSGYKGYTLSKNIINNLPNYYKNLNVQSHIIGPIKLENVPKLNNNILLNYFNSFFSLSYAELSKKIIENIHDNRRIFLYQKFYFIIKFPIVLLLKAIIHLKSLF